MRTLRLLALASSVLVSPCVAQQANSSTLHPGDEVRVEVWREKDLSGEFVVDEAGRVTLPLVGTRSVIGTPIAQLRDEIIEAYRRELANPSIIVTPLRRVYVLGEVNAPGLYKVDPTVSLAGAIAMAEGVTSSGDIRRLRIVRDGQVVMNHLPPDAGLEQIDIRSGDQIFVDRRGWFERNSTFVVSVLLSISSIAISLVR